jgi:hypothetical protein
MLGDARELSKCRADVEADGSSNKRVWEFVMQMVKWREARLATGLDKPLQR